MNRPDSEQQLPLLIEHDIKVSVRDAIGLIFSGQFRLRICLYGSTDGLTGVKVVINPPGKE